MDSAIFFSTSNGLFSRAVRWVTRSRVSHSGLATYLHGVPVLVHADFGGVQVTTLKTFQRRNQVVFTFAGKDGIDLGPALASAAEDIGESYDYVGLLGYLVVMVFRRWGRRVQNPLAGAKSTVCSELVARVCQKSVPGWSALDPEQTTPEDLLKLIEESNHFLRI